MELADESVDTFRLFVPCRIMENTAANEALSPAADVVCVLTGVEC